MDENARFVEELIQNRDLDLCQTNIILKLSSQTNKPEVCQKEQSGTLWRDAQRMTRLAGSVKKVWLKAQLKGNFQVVDPTELKSVMKSQMKLNLLRIDHWSPTDPHKSLHTVIEK